MTSSDTIRVHRPLHDYNETEESIILAIDFCFWFCQNVESALITAPPSVSAGGAMGSCDHSAVRVKRMLAVARHHARARGGRPKMRRPG
jgi:hypothetical protein